MSDEGGNGAADQPDRVLALLCVAYHRGRAGGFAVPDDDCLVRVRGHLEVTQVAGGLAVGVPVRAVDRERDFVRVGPTVAEGVDSGCHAANDGRDGETGVADCGFEELVVEDGAGTGDDGSHGTRSIRA